MIVGNTVGGADGNEGQRRLGSIPALFKTILAKKCPQSSSIKVKIWRESIAFWHLSVFHQCVILYTAGKSF
jgi:hypothetical protein